MGIAGRHDLEEVSQLSKEWLLAYLEGAAAGGFHIDFDFPTYMLREPHSNLDNSEDYLRALFFGESIAPYGLDIEWEEVPGAHGPTHVRFSLVVNENEAQRLAEVIAWHSKAKMTLDNSENADPEYEEKLNEFRYDLDRRVTTFNELAENFVRNLEVGLSEIYDGEELQEAYTELRETYKRWWDMNLEEEAEETD